MQSAPPDRYRVLVVEDDETIRHVLSTALEADGFEVRQATNGREAQAVLREWVPGVIVLDMMMPEMDGWQFLAHFRNGPLAQTPVVVVSGSYALQERLKPVQADAVFSKPFDLGALLDTVASLCGAGGQIQAAGP